MVPFKKQMQQNGRWNPQGFERFNICFVVCGQGQSYFADYAI